jgi:putative transposase
VPYFVCYYHVVWTTKNRTELINRLNEQLLLDAIEQQSVKLKCPILALNAVSDHVHVAVCIPPSTSVSQWVSKVKGFSSRLVNETYPHAKFHWQEGYGVITFGTKNIPFVKQYIQNQKEHHQNRTLYAHLEQTEE